MMKKKDQFDEDITSADDEKIEEQENLLAQKIKEKDENDMERKINLTQDVALRAIRKELKLERMVKREEKLKEKEKIKNLMRQKAKEEKKQECLEKALKEREEENQKGLNQQAAEKEIAKIKEATKKEVDDERDNLKKKLADIKRRSLRKQKVLEQQIQFIRGKMAQNLIDANKNGNMEVCNEKDPLSIKNYCDSAYNDNPVKHKECLDPAQFCKLCCEHEFGPMMLVKRDECLNMCDKKDTEQIGDWVWTTGTQSSIIQ